MRPSSGDIEATVSGVGFSSDANVTVGGILAGNVVVQSATTLLVTIAPRDARRPMWRSYPVLGATLTSRHELYRYIALDPAPEFPRGPVAQ